MPVRRTRHIPRFVPGRRGGINVVDALVQVLWNTETAEGPRAMAREIFQHARRRSFFNCRVSAYVIYGFIIHIRAYGALRKG